MNNTFKKIYLSEVKAHVVPASLADDIIDDLYVRYLAELQAEVGQDKFVDIFLDHDGCCLADRKTECFEIDGLVVQMPSYWLMDNIDQFQPGKVRYVNDKPYHKIYGAWNCLILTPEQLADLNRQIKARWIKIAENGVSDRSTFYSALNSLRECPLIEVSEDVPVPTYEN